ncbi:hypothetical protein GAYE_SCF39G5361 [Galdieria yellowstonensis]|uniref:RRM domain-containing protein n=1 Tax=Galdieria yellowstonensis TaxID=3028027 RepID=A0AAV9IJ75_9RHOD|nr:hypothetical protein GAYE_SCF39G5361 [Galdieria yellowstonensis]
MEDTKEQEEDKLDFYGDLFRNAPEIPNNEETEETVNHGLQQSENHENLADATLDPSKNTVSVSGLGWWFTDEELEHVACESSQGTSLRKTLKEVKFCYDSTNGKSTGEAFLIFDNATTAQEALKNLESHDFGRKVKLELTTEEVAQQETDWALKKSLNRNTHNRQHFQGRRNPLQKGAFEQSYRGQGATGPFPGNAAAAAHFAAAAAAAQKFPHSQTATMSAPPAFPFFTPFGFPAFPGRASNSNSMAANTAFANNNSQSNNNSNMPTGRTSQPESSSFFPPGFPPIPPHLFGYPPLAGMPPGSGFPGSFTSASAATGPFGNSPLNVPDASAVQSNMPVSSASSRYTGDKAKEEGSGHPSSEVYSKSRETRTKQDASQRRSSRDSSKSEEPSSDSRSRSDRHSKRHSRHEKKRSRHSSDSEDDSSRRDRSSRRKYRGTDHSRDRYERSSKRSSHEERRERGR